MILVGTLVQKRLRAPLSVIFFTSPASFVLPTHKHTGSFVLEMASRGALSSCSPDPGFFCTEVLGVRSGIGEGTGGKPKLKGWGG